MVEFSEEKFRKILGEYFDKYKDIKIAFDEVVKQLKKETQNK